MSARECEVAIVQALVPEAAIEALNVRIFRGFSGPDEMDLNPVLMRPAIQVIA